MNLQDLDLFKLLRLTHLTEEEKAAYTQRLLENAFGEIVINDLPQILSPEDLAQFNQLAEKEETKNQALELVKNKVPDFDVFLKDKLLAMKKSLVQANVEERLDINKQEREELRAQQDDKETLEKILANEKERANLEKQLKAINEDDWTTANALICS